MTVVALHQPSDRFDEFWEIYPKHTGRPVAKFKWDEITNGGLTTQTLDRDSGTYVTLRLQATADELIEGARRYRKKNTDKNSYRIKDEGKYIVSPANWLNRGMWMDE
jgi:hypothetical protein